MTVSNAQNDKDSTPVNKKLSFSDIQNTKAKRSTKDARKDLDEDDFTVSSSYTDDTKQAYFDKLATVSKDPTTEVTVLLKVFRASFVITL